jgi:hypothetical protein
MLGSMAIRSELHSLFINIYCFVDIHHVPRVLKAERECLAEFVHTISLASVAIGSNNDTAFTGKNSIVYVRDVTRIFNAIE